MVLFFSKPKKSPESGSLLKATNDVKTAQRTHSEAISREWAEDSAPACESAVKKAGSRRFIRVKLGGEAKVVERVSEDQTRAFQS